MPFLILYLRDGQKFDKNVIARGLEQIDGVKPLLGDSALEYSYRYGNDQTDIRLRKDEETIVIDGSGEASLDAALRIQSIYPETVQLIDESYSFDLPLNEIASVADLEQRIKDAGG